MWVMAIDAIDRKLLRELQRDAEASDEVLGQRLGLAPALVRTRRAALRARGAVIRQVAVVEATLLAPELQMLALVGFAHDDPRLAEAFERRMADDPAVLRCHPLTGEYEYALVVRVRDAAEYARWGQQALLSDRHLLHYSSFVMGPAVKDEWQALVPLAEDVDRTSV